MFSVLSNILYLIAEKTKQFSTARNMYISFYRSIKKVLRKRIVSLLMNSDCEEQNEKIVSGTLAQDNGFLVTLLHN